MEWILEMYTAVLRSQSIKLAYTVMDFDKEYL